MKSKRWIALCLSVALTGSLVGSDTIIAAEYVDDVREMNAEEVAAETEEASKDAGDLTSGTEGLETEIENGQEEAETPETEETASEEAVEEEAKAPKTEEAVGEEAETPKTEEAVGEEAETPKTEENAEEEAETPKTEEAAEEEAETPKTEEAAEEEAETPDTEETAEEEAETPVGFEKDVEASGRKALKVEPDVKILADGMIEVDVTSYGANGADNAADDKAIQQALDAVAENGGGTVRIPAGKYYIDKSLTIYSDTALILADNAEIIRSEVMLNAVDDSGSLNVMPMLRNYKGTAEEVLAGKGYGYTSNITISGGVWNGNVSGKSSDKSADIMRIYCASNVTLKDTKLTGCCGFHHANFGSVDGVTVSNVIFTGFVYYTGTDYSSLESNETNSNELNKTASITSEALQFDYFEDKNYYCRNMSVSGCTFDGVLSGVGNHHPEGSAVNVKIANNTFKNIANTCVNLYNFSGVEVSGNTAESVRTFARVDGGNDCVISGNTISTYTGKNGFNMFRISDGAVLTISGNQITGSGSAAIKLDSKSNAVITGNTIKDSTHNAINVNSSTAVITDNTIVSSGNIGVYFNSGSGSVVGNTVTNAKLRGIGIQSSSSITDLNNNTVKGGSEQGIYVSEQSAVQNIKGNTLTENGTGGISIIESTVTAIGGAGEEGNTITDSKTNGIYFRDSNVGTVSGNVISSSGTRGISCNSTKVTSMSGNTVNKSTGDGIYVADGSIVGTIGGSAEGKNIVTDIKANGIAVKDSEISEISYNEVKTCSSANIRVENPKTAVVISNNTLTAASKQGISTANAKAKIQNNTINTAGTYGIYLDGSKSDATVSNNVINTVKSGNGIRVCAGKATIKENTVKKSKTQGIYVVKGTVTLADNKVSGSGADGFKAKAGTIYMLAGNAKMKLSGAKLEVQGVTDNKVTTVTIPASVKVDKTVFQVTSVKDGAFKGNKKLTKVEIGSNISKIGKNAFYNCKNLANVTIKTTKLKDSNVGANAFKNIKAKCKFKVPKKKVSAYKKLLKNKGAGSKITVTK